MPGLCKNARLLQNNPERKTMKDFSLKPGEFLASGPEECPVALSFTKLGQIRVRVHGMQTVYCDNWASVLGHMRALYKSETLGYISKLDKLERLASVRIEALARRIEAKMSAK
jgi:hypothetical protein